jgi:hypothetical protein
VGSFPVRWSLPLLVSWGAALCAADGKNHVAAK